MVLVKNMKQSLMKNEIVKMESFIIGKDTFSKHIETIQLNLDLKQKEENFKSITQEKVKKYLDLLFLKSGHSSNSSSFQDYHSDMMEFFQNKKHVFETIERIEVDQQRKKNISKIVLEINNLLTKYQPQIKETIEPFLKYSKKLKTIIMELVMEFQLISKKIPKSNEEIQFLKQQTLESVIENRSFSKKSKDFELEKSIFVAFLKSKTEIEILNDIDTEITSFTQSYKYNLDCDLKKKENELTLILESLKKLLYEELETINYIFPEMKEDQILQMYQKLESKQIVNVIGDGHCLCRSIAHLIYGDQSYYLGVYQQMIKFLKENGEKIDESLKDFAISHKDILSHLLRIQNQRILTMEDWPNNNVYLQIISEAFNIDLELFYFEDFPKYTDIFHPKQNVRETKTKIHIANFNNLHYSPLIEK